ncbi:stress-induced protein KIN2-like [Pyrus ussuriensis x Pyrus communis]|uniref:Stress-induced protein KIN2-like n=2 Tax=Pyrus TaxID=3766 RepID=A0A5N5G4T9_9ROSA|nr:stress-induced protein KIN2-like [Pyrus ussuriensis x Pyrus communis]
MACHVLFMCVLVCCNSFIFMAGSVGGALLWKEKENYFIKMNQSQNMSHQAGQAKGQAQEKASGMMDQMSNAAQSAKESAQGAGQQMMEKAQGAADSVKDAVGANKRS